MANIILASSSPRRRELLQQLGLDFEIHSPDIDESVLAEESVEQYVERLACAKAEAIFQQYPNTIIIAADTTVAVDQHILGKPESKQHAFKMWELISGRKHRVLTSVCVRTKQEKLSIVVCTEVEFQVLSLNDMECYWDTREPMGKAGGYAIQGIAARYIPNIIGSYTNVVGLPLHETAQLLQRVKVLN